MNERYLFRGQRVDTKEWVYGYYFKTPLTDENSGTKPDDGWLFLADGKDRHCISDKHGCAYVVIPETVGLWTTLKDKNGKLIFEGDIIKITRGKTDKTEFPPKIQITDVYYDKGAFRYRWNDGSGSVIDFNSVEIVKGCESITQDVEVIGNIHQNSELLEKGGK